LFFLFICGIDWGVFGTEWSRKGREGEDWAGLLLKIKRHIRRVIPFAAKERTGRKETEQQPAGVRVVDRKRRRRVSST
jgi:hypothetical protein